MNGGIRMPLIVGVVIAALIGGIAAAFYLQGIGERVTTIESRVTTIETRRVLTPCLHTNDRACRVFLNRLLASATREQLRRLRGDGLRSPREIRSEIRRFEQDRRRAAEKRRRKRKGVVPDNKPSQQGQPGAAQTPGAWGRPLDPPRLNQRRK